jgi:hypothetical protein
MVATWLLQGALVVGSVTVLVAATVVVHRYLPRAYPRDETALDPRSYHVVRTAFAAGLPTGAGGAVLSLVETVGGVRVASGTTGLLPGIALLVPAWVGPWTARLGVGLLLAAALLAGAVELRAAIE